MNKKASECRRPFSALPFLRRGFLLCALLCGPALYAQLTLSQTYGIPHSVDGESLPIFFNFSAQYPRSDAAVVHTQLAIDFGKAADLFNDPPFYSDIGFVLRKLDSTFSLLGEVTLLNIGSFNDGVADSSFNGIITFDDTATLAVDNDPDQPAAGLFRPIQALSMLNGTYSPYWELRLVDAVSGSPLLFHSATLTTTLAATVPVPEPASVGLAGAGLLGVLLIRRRRSAAV